MCIKDNFSKLMKFFLGDNDDCMVSISVYMVLVDGRTIQKSFFLCKNISRFFYRSYNSIISIIDDSNTFDGFKNFDNVRHISDELSGYFFDFQKWNDFLIDNIFGGNFNSVLGSEILYCEICFSEYCFEIACSRNPKSKNALFILGDQASFDPLEFGIYGWEGCHRIFIGKKINSHIINSGDKKLRNAI